MEDTPEVSVVIPAYNAAVYLARAVDSVLAQEDCRYELIIVDNNSTDTTAEIARAYQARFPEKIRLMSETKPGASAARNKGLARARAPWAQFLDADDELLPRKLERQLNLVEPGLDWIVGTIRMRNQDGRETDATIAADPWQGLLTYTGLGHLDANLFRTETLRQLGGFNEEYLNCNDFELFFRLVKGGRNYAKDFVPGAILIHHSGPRITNTDRKGMARQRLELTLRVIDDLKKNHPVYFQAQRKAISTALLLVLRKQATVDMVAATRNFKRFFPEGFHAAELDQAALPVYVVLYPVIGFRALETARVVLGRILPKRVRRFLKRV